MLRALLAERFSLSSHWEDKTISAYTLTVDADGLKLKPSDRRGDSAETETPPYSFYKPTTGLTHFDGSVTLAKLASRLSAEMDRPVVDATGISGAFDIYLDAHIPPKTIPLPPIPAFQGQPPISANPVEPETDWKLPNGRVVPGNAPPISSALRKLGLRLERSKVPVKVLVIDTLNKIPTEN
jgi:uncharacterized protein (TIGR03435 family)